MSVTQFIGVGHIAILESMFFKMVLDSFETNVLVGGVKVFWMKLLIIKLSERCKREKKRKRKKLDMVDTLGNA